MAARSILASDLRTADILVTTGRAFVSGVIRTGTGTDYSHTILYIGDGRIVEAISKGVVERDLSDALAETTLAVALRRRFMTPKTKTDVVRFARGFTGRPYDSVGAGGAGLAHKRGKLAGAAACAMSPAICVYGAYKVSQNASDKNKDKKFFCSELAARCFELASVPISKEEPSYMTPRSVRVAANLMYTGHLVGGP